ncbi:MAG: hypothetical protein GTO46_15555 [Gemmatimonadetes bacterium]|nr:hypothetical protein [Gemmatimonadota bacterium]NIO33053.1 hypothetical protein [Gemmatimonadota bacterium]
MYKTTSEAILALAFAALVASCSNADPIEPVEDKNNGGTGNQTLLVVAEVDLELNTGGFLADFFVDVEDGSGAPVSGAAVTIVWNRSTVTVPESGTPGIYEALVTGAASGDLKLDVVKDDMYVRDVVLGNIGIQAVLEPLPDATLPANEDLTVRWVSDLKAQSASLFSPDWDFDVEDNGEFVVPGAQVDPSSSTWIELERYNEVEIAGGLSGSYFKLEVEYRVEGLEIAAAL